ncbi:MAG: hypothetical protein WBB48_04860 [Thermodesulfobacteriota bacterium]
MKNFLVCTVLMILMLVIVPSVTHAQSPYCLPTCEIDDGRFLAISEGSFETFTPGVMNIQIIVPPGTAQFSYGIFDGDSPGAIPTGHWDLGSPSQFSYVLFIDPDLDNTGPIASQTMATSLPSNDWMDFTINTDPSALDGNGNFVYTLQITLLDDVNTLNLFKVRSSELLSLDEQFGIVANFASDEDGVTIYPNLNTADGIQPSDYAVTTYDGNFCVNFMLPDPLPELEIWDADLDHGNADGTDLDTDDLNSPNSVPSFVLPGSDALNEGANDSQPDDDRSISGPGDFNNFFIRSPAVRYTLTFPDGRMFENVNPSGNQEWERFVISSIETDPTLVDHTTGSPAPAGRYELCLEGLDMANLSAFRLPLPYIPSFIPPPEPGCCVASQGVCSIDLETACSVPPNLSFLGEGTTCTGEPLCDPPPEPGCCVESQGICSVELETACSVPPNLQFLGEGTSCTAEPLCEPPPEPGCCVASQGVCSVDLETACPVPPNLSFLGEGTSCTAQPLCTPPPTDPPPTPAPPGCCVASQGVCSLELEGACAVPPNLQFLGDGISCAGETLCDPPPPTDPPPTPGPTDPPPPTMGCCVE